MKESNDTIKVTAQPGQPLGAIFVAGHQHRGALVKKLQTVRGAKGQLEVLGVKPKMQLVSVDDHNVCNMTFEDIILLLRVRSSKKKILVFNHNLGKISWMKKYASAFTSNASTRRESKVVRRLRNALSFSSGHSNETNSKYVADSPPQNQYWIYDQEFSKDMVRELEERIKSRPHQAARRIQSIFRGKSSRKKRGISIYKSHSAVDSCTFEYKDFEVSFESKTLGLRITECNDAERPTSLKRYHVCVKKLTEMNSVRSSDTRNLLKNNDLLIGCRTKSFENASFEEVRKFLKSSSKRPLYLTFRRWNRVKQNVASQFRFTSNATKSRDSKEECIAAFKKDTSTSRKDDDTMRHESAVRIQAAFRGRACRRVLMSPDAVKVASSPSVLGEHKINDGVDVDDSLLSRITSTPDDESENTDGRDQGKDSAASDAGTIPSTEIDDVAHVDGAILEGRQSTHEIAKSAVLSQIETLAPETREGTHSVDRNLRNVHESTSNDIESEMKSVSKMLPLNSSAARLFGRGGQRLQRSHIISRDPDGTQFDVLQTKCELSIAKDPLILSLSNAAEKTARRLHNKEILAEFMKWHDRRDRPIIKLRPKRRGKMLLQSIGRS